MYVSAEILDLHTQVDEIAVDKLLEVQIKENERKIIVLDDDPTGVQTVHDISVYTDWTIDSIRRGFLEPNNLFFILTNSRSMTEEMTKAVHADIVANIAAIAKETDKAYLIISRSDSTLRGHFPLETETLRTGMVAQGIHIDGEILCPFFKEGGRFTINNVHYVKQNDMLIPAAESEFARDKTFAYTKSSLPEYIEEKTCGSYNADQVICIELETLRAGDIHKVEQQLLSVNDFNKVCVNAVDYIDLKVFAVGLYRAMAKGKNFIFRTAASFVKIIGGVSEQPLLTRKDMLTEETSNGGIVVVGSYTKKTTMQLERLRQLDFVVPIEFKSNLVLKGDAAFYSEVERCVEESEKAIMSGKTAVCYSCRELLVMENDTPESALIRSVKISNGIQSLVGCLKVIPSFIIAKGGITSSDVGTKALLVKCAKVLGQIKPGIPVWQTGNESRFPSTPYVIFPGNTGDESTLREIVEILSGKENTVQ